jgi:hypothetical protein
VFDESSVPHEQVSRLIEKRLGQITHRTGDEPIEDGMTLSLGVGVMSCIGEYGEACLERIASRVMKDEGDPEVLSHILRWTGRMQHAESFQGRLRLLVRALEAPSATTRDGAALGLVALRSGTALQALRDAAATETNEELRQDLEDAATHLRSIT